MTAKRHIAVIDVGKTNAKLALVDLEQQQEIAVVTRPNTVRPAPPYPHFDLEGHWAFFLHHLAAFQAEHGVDGISVTTHGAAAVLLDGAGQLATPMLDYEHDGPDRTAQSYDALRPPFAQTGSPRLPLGLNLGAQLHWLMTQDATLAARTAHVLTYPQYWGYRLTGQRASDMSSLGCHTDLWAPQTQSLSDLPARLGLANKIAPRRNAGDVLGPIAPEIAKQTGIAPGTPVLCGIHDSNASLLPHLLARRDAGPFSVVSTGTWVIAMAVGAVLPALDPARDTLINTDAFGAPVPSARFMGGREFDLIRAEGIAPASAQDRDAVVARGLYLMPSVVCDSGPFAGQQHRWSAEPGTAGERMVALSWYLAQMTRVCLDLIGAQGPVIIEGPFARNRDYLDMLACLSPDGVETAASATGTSIGAALLFRAQTTGENSRHPLPGDAARLRAHAAAWTAATQAEIANA